MITSFSPFSAVRPAPRAAYAPRDHVAPLFDRLVRARLAPFCCGTVCVGAHCHAPWVFGPEVESICRADVQLQQRLLPYLQTLFWEAALHEAAVLRPLLYHFPDDARAYQVHDQVLLGFWLMAAPVEQSGVARPIYLPSGRWYDWWGGSPVDGPDHLFAHAPAERLPLYVRAGAVIPSIFDAALVLDLFPGNGGFTLYEGDDDSADYGHGRFCTTSYRLRAGADRLRFSIGSRAGAYSLPLRPIELRVHDVGTRAAELHPGAGYDHARRILTLRLDDDGRARELEFAV